MFSSFIIFCHVIDGFLQRLANISGECRSSPISAHLTPYPPPIAPGTLWITSWLACEWMSHLSISKSIILIAFIPTENYNACCCISLGTNPEWLSACPVRIYIYSVGGGGRNMRELLLFIATLWKWKLKQLILFVKHNVSALSRRAS